MPISGLTLTLHQDARLVAEAVEEMRTKPEIVVGEGNGRWLAAVIDCEDQFRCRDLHRWIESLSGVEFADVVYVAFDEASDAPAESGSASGHNLEPLSPSHR